MQRDQDAHLDGPEHVPAASPAPTPRPPEPRPPTRLLRDLLDVTEVFERSLGATLSVNPTDLDAMQHLIQHGPLSPTELSRRLGISPAATTTVIDRLEALSHVHREPNPGDRRSIRVVPSPASRAKAMASLMPMIMGVDAVLDDFSAEEQEVVARYLERVVASYRMHAEPSEEISGSLTGQPATPEDTRAFADNRPESPEGRPELAAP